MTLEELKDTVRTLIGRAKTDDAIDKIIKWAQNNHKDQLENDISILQGKLSKLNRNLNMGVISNSDVAIGQSQINLGVLNLLDGVDEKKPEQAKPIEDDGSTEPKKILMLTANPARTTKLTLDEEYAVISHKLQKKQDFFSIIREKAVSGTEFKEFTQREEPDILHFSGHGEGGKYAGIVVQNNDKNEKALIPIGGLKSLFKFFKRKFDIKVVLLNACHTQEQAATISEYVEYVIGTNVAIGDAAASAFSSGFYFQLAEDDQMDVEFAFESGRAEATMQGAEEENFVIYRDGELLEIE